MAFFVACFDVSFCAVFTFYVLDDFYLGLDGLFATFWGKSYSFG